jgi:hypothetical protein
MEHAERRMQELGRLAAMEAPRPARRHAARITLRSSMHFIGHFYFSLLSRRKYSATASA